MKNTALFKVSTILLTCSVVLQVITYVPNVTKIYFTMSEKNNELTVLSEVGNKYDGTAPLREVGVANENVAPEERDHGDEKIDVALEGAHEHLDDEIEVASPGEEEEERKKGDKKIEVALEDTHTHLDDEKEVASGEEEQEEEQVQGRVEPPANENDQNDQNDNVIHPIDEYITTQTTEGSSLQILLSKLKKHSLPEAYGDEIRQEDVEIETQRCARYGYEFNPSIKKRRRIFMGSLIADDTWHVIASHAVEAYGLYHTVAFIESNTTQTKTKRQIKFSDKTSLNWRMLQSDIFGPKTDVYVDFRVDAAKDYPDVKPIMRENLQREHITKRWKAAGMQPDDVGIVCDVDEVFTRDFLLALQSCDIPQFRPGQDCFRPQVTGQALFFEGSPECQFAEYGIEGYFRHPNAIIGECVDRIGDYAIHEPDINLRKIRTHFEGGHLLGSRNFDKFPNRTMYPLWQPWDFRNSPNDENLVLQDGHLHSAFHFHNFFESFEGFRNKYNTYGHKVDGADKLPLVEVNNKVKELAVCLKGKDGKHGRFDEIKGRRPIMFEREPYRTARHNEMIDNLEADEKVFGNNFDEPQG